MDVDVCTYVGAAKTTAANLTALVEQFRRKEPELVARVERMMSVTERVRALLPVRPVEVPYCIGVPSDSPPGWWPPTRGVEER